MPSDGSSTWYSGKEDKLSTPSSTTVLCLKRRASYSSPVCFIAGLDRIFRLYDHVNPGMTVDMGADSCPYGEVWVRR